jgi:hypothetical protein
MIRYKIVSKTSRDTDHIYKMFVVRWVLSELPSETKVPKFEDR